MQIRLRRQVELGIPRTDCDTAGAGVTTVQRINTVGGKLEGACDKAGTFKSAPYSADYVFLRKG